MFGYTISNIKILDLYKGSGDIGDIIQIREPYCKDESDKNVFKYYHRIDGFKNEVDTEHLISIFNYYPCENGKEYIFFLSKDSEENPYRKDIGDNSYNLVGGDRGRYIIPTSKDEFISNINLFNDKSLITPNDCKSMGLITPFYSDINLSLYVDVLNKYIYKNDLDKDLLNKLKDNNDLGDISLYLNKSESNNLILHNNFEITNIKSELSGDSYFTYISDYVYDNEKPDLENLDPTKFHYSNGKLKPIFDLKNDVEVKSIYPINNGSELPFNAENTATIGFIIENKRSLDIKDCDVAIMVNQEVLDIITIPILYAFTAFTVYFDLNNVPNGDYNIGVVANYNNKFDEINLTNNSKYREFSWVNGKPDLAVTSVELKGNDKDETFFSSELSIPITIKIANLGTDIASGNTNVFYSINNSPEKFLIAIPNMVAGSEVEIPVNLKIVQSGNTNIKISVKNNTADEINKSNNSFNLEPEIFYEPQQNKLYYTETGYIDLKLNPSIENYSKLIDKAINNWNSIPNSGVHINKVLNNTNSAFNIKIENDIPHLYDSNIKIYGITYNCYTDTVHNLSRPNDRYISSGQIILFPDFITLNDNTKEHLITHEIGHLLGLADTDYNSIMNVNENFGIQNCDIAFIRARYSLRKYLKTK